MSRISSLVFLVAGGILLFYGFNAHDSLSSNVTEAVTGAPSNKSIWLIVLGAVGLVAGAAGLFIRRKT